jgi:hypothetical protein
MYSACSRLPARLATAGRKGHLHGEDDVRFIMTGTLLCVLASTAIAGEHYTEIWNPPEARTPGMHPPAPGKKPHSDHGTKHKLASSDRPATRRVAEPAMRAPASVAPATPGTNGTNGTTTPNPGRMPEIPPQIGPDGNVLQVSYRIPARRVPQVNSAQ